MDLVFHQLKEAFSTAPIISPPEPGAPFVLTTNACATGIGVALTQQLGDNVRHLGFFSKRLRTSQHNYSATELEAFAIQAALRHFAPLIYGSSVCIHTDHRPLLHLDDNKKLMRWTQTIQQFPHTIKYVPGESNVVADALSRSWDSTLDGAPFKKGEMLDPAGQPQSRQSLIPNRTRDRANRQS